MEPACLPDQKMKNFLPLGAHRTPHKILVFVLNEVNTKFDSFTTLKILFNRIYNACERGRSRFVPTFVVNHM